MFISIHLFVTYTITASKADFGLLLNTMIALLSSPLIKG